MTALPGPDPETWNRLAESADNIFATHTWAQLWWDVYGEGATPHVLYDDLDGPHVILPLLTTGRLVTQVRFIGHGPADLLGPVCAPADLHLARPLLEAALARHELAGQVLLLQDMAVSNRWWEPLQGRRVSTEVSPVLRFEPGQSWPDYLATKSKNFRSQAVRKPARLAESYDVRYRLATAETIEVDLESLFALHEDRWRGETPLADGPQRRFTDEFARAALRHGWLRLWVLELDGRPVACLLAFRFGTAEYYYQLGRDPQHDADSVGFAVVVHAVRAALESGAAEFRFLRGDEGYKLRFANEEADIETIAVPRGLRGRASVAAGVRRRRPPDATKPQS